MKYGFGVDLGGTTVKIAYFDENGTMLDTWEIPTVTAEGGKQILISRPRSTITGNPTPSPTLPCWAWALAFPGP